MRMAVTEGRGPCQEGQVCVREVQGCKHPCVPGMPSLGYLSTFAIQLGPQVPRDVQLQRVHRWGTPACTLREHDLRQAAAGMMMQA